MPVTGGIILAGVLIAIVVALTRRSEAARLPSPARLPPFRLPENLPGVPLEPGQDIPARTPGLSSPAKVPARVPVPKKVKAAVEAIQQGKTVAPEVLAPAVEAAREAGLPDTAAKLAEKLDKTMTEEIPALVRAPDVDGEPIPIDGRTGKKLWFIDVRGKMVMAIPNFPAQMASFKALQNAIGVKADGRIGPGTLAAFVTKVAALGFQRHPQRVEALAANAVKWTDILKKHFQPGQVGRPFDVPSRNWREFVARVNADWDKLAPKVKEKFGSYLGQTIQGRAVTLSGLCGVVNRAGMRGAESWLKNESDRVKYPATTHAFEATNGLF